jgi:hypothetical protein
MQRARRVVGPALQEVVGTANVNKSLGFSTI